MTVGGCNDSRQLPFPPQGLNVQVWRKYEEFIAELSARFPHEREGIKKFYDECWRVFNRCGADLGTGCRPVGGRGGERCWEGVATSTNGEADGAVQCNGTAVVVRQVCTCLLT